MNINIKNIGFFIIFSFYCPLTYSCIITFTNDSTEKILIRDMNSINKTQFILLKGKTRRFGHPNEHADFEVYTKKGKSPLFNLAYKCKQNDCGITKNPHIKLSDLHTQSDNIKLFTVINHQQTAQSQKTNDHPCCGGN